jgi:membrane-associated protease RseP (regulator of RpoE activity)
MKTTRLIPVALLLFAASLYAEGPIRRTVIIRDGKVVSSSDGDVMRLNGDLFGGKRAFLGVTLIDLTPELREMYGASKDAGVLVGSVEDGSPADKAGIHVGDIVLSIDGTSIDSSSDLRRGLRDKKDGDTARLEVLRGKNRQAIVATVVEREGPRLFEGGDIEELTRQFNSPEWRARIERAGGDCGDLQVRIRELETRLKDLEKKLQK